MPTGESALIAEIAGNDDAGNNSLLERLSLLLQRRRISLVFGPVYYSKAPHLVGFRSQKRDSSDAWSKQQKQQAHAAAAGRDGAARGACPDPAAGRRSRVASLHGPFL